MTELTQSTDSTSSTSTPPPPVQPAAFATVSITNQLAQPVEIYDEFNPSTDTQQEPIVYTSLGVIQPGATAEVHSIRQVALLVAAITGTVDELNGNFYHRFPVKAMSGTMLKFAPQTLAYTITADDRSAAIASFKFQKYIVANPDAALTKSFNAALKGGFAAVNAFFKASKTFTQCTMASWHTVLTWLGNDTSGWQGPYYLYEVAPSPAPSDFTPHLVATLNIQSDANNDTAVLTMCAADASGNPIFATPAQRTTLTMAGDSTLQDADPGGDVPVVLTPVWMNVISTPLTNGTPVPKFLIGPAFSGTVAGSHVVSSQTARQVPGKEAKSKSETSDFDKGFSKLCQVVGLIVGLAMLYEMGKKKYEDWKEKKEKARSEAEDEAELEQENGEIDAAAEADLNAELAPVEAANAQAAEQVAAVEAAVVHEQQAEVLDGAIDAHVEQVEDAVQAEVAESGVAPSQNLEDAVSQVEQDAAAAKEAVEAGNLEPLEPLNQSINNLGEVAASEAASVQSEVAELQQSAAEGVKEVNELKEAEQEREADSEQEDEDAVDESQEEEPESDPIIEAE